MKKPFSVACIILSILTYSCSDDEGSVKDWDLIIISNAGNPGTVRFSTYSYLSKNLNENVLILSSTDHPVVITSVASTGDNLYVLTGDRKPGLDKIELINSLNWTITKSADLNLAADSSRIAISNDKILVAGLGGDGKTY